MSDITAAPHPITLSGKEYSIKPLTDENFDELDLWIRGQFIKNAKAADDPDVTKIAIKESAYINWRSEDGQAILNTPKGLTKLLHLSMIRVHPNLEESQCRKWLNEEENLSAFLEVFSQCNFGVSTLEDDDDDDDGKKPSKKKVTKKRDSSKN